MLTWGSNPLGPIGLDAGDDRLTNSTLAMLLDRVPVSLAVMVGPEHRYVLANALHRSVLGLGTDVIGLPVAEVLPEALAPWIERLDAVLASGEPFESAAVAFPDATRWWHVRLYPLRDDDGDLVGTLSLGLDTTAEVLARDEAAARAAEAERQRERLQLAVEATELGMWEWDVPSNQVFWSDRQKAIFGLPPDAIPHYELWRDAIHPDDRDRVVATVASLLDPASGGQLAFEHRVVQPSGAVRWIGARGRMIYREEDGRRVPVRLLGSVLDITERKAGEEARQLLLREMDHRVKNLFAVTAGIVSASAHEADSARAMAEAVLGRLSALSVSHDLIHPLVDGEHGRGAVALGDLVAATLKPLARDGSTAVVSGPRVDVAAAAAPSLALVLNELATNAAKYGALRDGSLAVDWTVEEGELRLAWRETAAAAAAHPGRSGFGSLLIARTVEAGLRGRLERAFTASGLEVRLTVPMARLAPD